MNGLLIIQFEVRVNKKGSTDTQYNGIPAKLFDVVMNDWKAGKVQIYNDYMDQGWGLCDPKYDEQNIYADDFDDKNGTCTICMGCQEPVFMKKSDLMKYLDAANIPYQNFCDYALVQI